MLLGTAADAAPVEIPLSGNRLCLSADRAWTEADGQTIAFGGGRPTLRTPLPGVLAPYGCTAEGALFRDRVHPDKHAICIDDCRAVTLPAGAPRLATTTFVAGKLVAISQHGGVLGVWREGAKPAFFALPDSHASPLFEGELPAMALTDGKVIDVVARGKDTFVVIRIPAV
jgi:hypothetical protein